MHKEGARVATSVYRCSDGHLFTSTYLRVGLSLFHVGVPGTSSHLQRCPVDHRWRMVRPVNPNELDDSQLGEARRYRL